MQEPAVRPGRGVLSISGAIDPVALARLVLDLEIVSDGRHFGVACPPLAEDTFGPIGPLHAPAHAAPGKEGGGMIW
jgi:hypothetical protein